MKPFDYIAPTSLDEATGVLARLGPSARLLAGGTDLLVELRSDRTKGPESIIDLSRIASLRGIELTDDAITIKPLTTHASISRSGVVRMHAPCLAMAASTIGSPQIRNRGTIGGNIANAAACADTVPPLIALGTILTLTSASGSRECPLEDFFIRPYATVAQPDEILTSIRCSVLPHGARGTFIKLGRRNSVSIARLSLAAVVSCDRAGNITDARIVPGAAFPTWKRATEAEEALLGHRPSPQLLAEAGTLVAKSMVAVTGRRWSTEYKEPVISVLVRRALESCVGRD